MALNYVEALAETAKMGQLPHFKTYVRELNLLDQRWTTYFDNTRSLYLWELAINRRIHNRSRRDETGFLPVPNLQYHFLHPSIALEYIDDEQEGNKLEESIVLEVVGLNRWSWKKDSSETKLALGASLIAAYSDLSLIHI